MCGATLNHSHLETKGVIQGYVIGILELTSQKYLKMLALVTKGLVYWYKN